MSIHPEEQASQNGLQNDNPPKMIQPTLPEPPKDEEGNEIHPMLINDVYYSRWHTYKHDKEFRITNLCMPSSEPTTNLKCPRKGHPLHYVSIDDDPYRCNLCMRRMDEFLRCDKCDFDICLDCLNQYEDSGIRVPPLCCCCCCPCIPIPKICKNGLCYKKPKCCFHWLDKKPLPRRPNQKQVYACCGLINRTAIESFLIDKAQEGFAKIDEQTEEMFKELKGAEKDADEHLKSLFAQFDTDGSGTLQIKELQSFLGQFIEANFGDRLEEAVKRYQHIQDKFWEKTFEKLDTNGDGQIDREEFMAKIMGILEDLEIMMDKTLEKAEKLAIKKLDEVDGEKTIPFRKRPKKPEDSDTSDEEEEKKEENKEEKYEEKADGEAQEEGEAQEQGEA